MAKQAIVTDDDWSKLLDDKAITQRRGLAETKFRDLSNDQVKYLRRLAKTDLFFLASGPLEYTRLSEKFHGHVVSWYDSVSGERYRLILLPRDHYKSTLFTISDSVRIALPNDAGVQYHPHFLGPNVKVLLAHENRESASRFLYGITAAFTQKLLMLALFPECIPTKRVQRVNKYELELPREEHHLEPTFDTIGTGGAAQSRHFHWLKLDDLVGEEARDSETVMKRVILWFDNIHSLLTRLRVDGWDLVGTRWSANDVYGYAMKKYGVRKKTSVLNALFKDDIARLEEGQLACYMRGAEEAGLPVFPEEFTTEDLAVLRKSPVVWASQYANNPRDTGLTELHPSWLKFYNIGNNGRITVFAGESSWSVNVRDLDICVLIDPARSKQVASDPSGIVVTGTDKNMNIYILEAYKERLQAPQLMDRLFQLYTRWNPRLISIEDVAFSGIYKHWFEERCQRIGVYPNIHLYSRPGGRNAKSKNDYIRGLSNYAAGGQLYALEGMHQLRDEWEWFPMGDGEHILDALSQGLEVWSPGKEKHEAQEQQRAIDVVNDYRDALTGY